MEGFNLNEPPIEDVVSSPRVVVLWKDGKPISRVKCYHSGLDTRSRWTITRTPSIEVSTLPSDKFIMKGDFQNAHQQFEWARFLSFLQDFNRVAVVESAVYDFYILPPGVSGASQVEVAYERRISALELEHKHLEPYTCEGVAGFRNSPPQSHEKIVVPVKRHDAGNDLDNLAKLVQIRDASCTSLGDSLLHVSQSMEDDPEAWNAYAEERNILCTKPANSLEEMAERSHRPVKKIMSPTSDFTSRCHIQPDTTEPSLVDWIPKPHLLAKDPKPMKASDFSMMMLPKKDRHMLCKQSQSLAGSHLRNYGSGGLATGDGSSYTIEHTERALGSQLATKQPDSLSGSYVRTHPSYFKTLGQMHSGWIFGAIAELVDNARDAYAKRMDIFIESMYLKREGKEIPVLSFVDDGCGMSHQEIVRMVSLGHKQPEINDLNHIGRYGIGFKAGAMRLGRNALVISQASNSRSIAFVSQSFNEDGDIFEIPIVSYRWQSNFMEVDTDVQSEAEASAHLKSIKEFSPFNEYVIGEKSALFGKNGTGTQIYIWDLDRWGSDYSLEWTNDDIMIRSRRVRTRAGQIGTQVPLDFSLCCYLQVIFLEPRMKIRVQGSLVKTRPLAKSLSMTVVVDDFIDGKFVQLTLGRCQSEWERRNCGVFLYWHGRLIEAYKRVGGMIHSADVGRGILGVMNVTNIMSDGDGKTHVLSNKQGFEDCEAYAKLEEWLGYRCDEYWDKYYDDLVLVKATAKCKPDNEWVQCNKCLKWRRLDNKFDTKLLPSMWFCNMEPFSGLCSMPEEMVEPGVVTVSQTRTHQLHDPGLIPTGI